MAKAPRYKLRHFSDAAMPGSEANLESVLAALLERFGPMHKCGARKLRGVEANGMRRLRDLQVGAERGGCGRGPRPPFREAARPRWRRTDRRRNRYNASENSSKLTL